MSLYYDITSIKTPNEYINENAQLADLSSRQSIEIQQLKQQLETNNKVYEEELHSLTEKIEKENCG